VKIDVFELCNLWRVNILRFFGGLFLKLIDRLLTSHVVQPVVNIFSKNADSNVR